MPHPYTWNASGLSSAKTVADMIMVGGKTGISARRIEGGPTLVGLQVGAGGGVGGLLVCGGWACVVEGMMWWVVLDQGVGSWHGGGCWAYRWKGFCYRWKGFATGGRGFAGVGVDESGGAGASIINSQAACVPGAHACMPVPACHVPDAYACLRAWGTCLPACACVPRA